MSLRTLVIEALRRFNRDSVSAELARSAPLSSIAKAIVGQRLTYVGASSLQRIEACARHVDASSVPGQFVEFGVALGGTSILLAELASRAQRKFQGFDVFSMIPPPSSPKDDEASRSRYALIAAGQSEGIDGDAYYGYRDDLLSAVTMSFQRNGMTVDGENIALRKGLFADTWPEFAPAAVALAHLDCDWYDPVAYCLSAVDRTSSPGTMIILDDYHAYSGCKAATDEFLHSHVNYACYSGQNVVLVRRY